MSNELRPLARHIFEALGEASNVHRYGQDFGSLWIDVGVIHTSETLQTWATIGMSRFDGSSQKRV